MCLTSEPLLSDAQPGLSLLPDTCERLVSVVEGNIERLFGKKHLSPAFRALDHQGETMRPTAIPAPSSIMLVVAREPLNRIEVEYRRRIDSMSISERVQRAEALLSWARGFVARQILAEQGPRSDDRLKWEVALRQYGADPATRALIERMGVRARG